jgi:hypothetical protein
VEAVHQYKLPQGYLPDILLRRKGAKPNTMPLLLLLEVAVNDSWWKMADQNASYVKSFLAAAQTGATVFS